MGGKLNIYNLGVSGVVVDKSPIHEADGELLRAQNAQVDSVGALGGIRKRDGFSQLNPLVLAGAVTGMLPLPLPDDGLLIPKFYLPLESGPTWKTSFDGVTWSDTAIPSRAATTTTASVEIVLGMGDAIMWRGFRNHLYFPGDDYVQGVGNPTIHLWDGEDDVVIGRITPSPYGSGAPSKAVTSFIPYANNELLVASADSNAGYGATRIFILNTSTHRLTHIGPQTNLTDGWIFGGMIVWQGRIWIGGYHAGGGTAVSIWRSRRTDATWTPETTGNGTAHGYVTGMVVFKGELYVSYAADIGAKGNIYKRTAAGVWSEVYFSDSTAANNFVGPMIVSRDGLTLFAFQSAISGGAAPLVRILQTTNGTSYSLAYNVSSALSDSHNRSGMPYLDSGTGTIYWPIASGAGGGQSGMVKRTTAGTWSVVLSALTTVRGPLGIIRT